eukprot:TRINITY_DN76064_c0_g1_i1.p1 TRINITY_DN76064_c0_g1~~TRINITY_DN76064_c0_g1_i1.p1  ORF type:complete len:266 (-),score=38.02 TRINITY_DN76064_c0_g1_i1:81-878(-)
MGFTRVDAGTSDPPSASRSGLKEVMANVDISYPTEIKYDRLPSMSLSVCLEEDEPDEVDEFDAGEGVDAASRVDAIITRATDQLVEDSSTVVLTDRHNTKQLRAGDGAGSSSPSRPRQAQAQVLMGTGAKPAPHKAPEIARILAKPTTVVGVHSYAAANGFWRVPEYFAEMQIDFEEEEDYIRSLRETMESPSRRVRLLAQSEKECLVNGLKQQFQKATAIYLKATPGTRDREELDNELARIKRDIDNLSRPFIFVEADNAQTSA